MRKVQMFVLVILALGVFAPAASAQEGAAAAASPWLPLAAGFSMAVAAAFCGLAQSRVASAACEGMARNPGAADSVRLAMILGLVFIETLALFTLLVVFTALK